MGELNADEAARMLEVFLPAYNALHGTDFAFDKEATLANESAPGSNRDPSIDYVCTSSTGERLALQHTEAWCDAPTERLWPRRVGWIRRSLQAEVAKLPGAPYFVWLNVVTAPEAPEEAAAIVRVLIDEIHEHIGLLDGSGPVEWRPDEITRERVSRVSLRRLGEFETPRSAYEQTVQRLSKESLARTPLTSSHTQVIASDVHLDPVGMRAARALEKKQIRYAGTGRDLVLLVHYRVTSYDMEDQQEVAQAVQEAQADFKEVWAVSTWSMDSGLAHRILIPHSPTMR